MMTDEMKQEIEAMKAALAQLETAGGELFSAEIVQIKSKIEEKVQVAEEAEKAAVAEVKAEVAEIEQTVIDKYGKVGWEVLKAAALVAILIKLFA